jgi:uncharacterized membrane protein
MRKDSKERVKHMKKFLLLLISVNFLLLYQHSYVRAGMKNKKYHDERIYTRAKIVEIERTTISEKNSLGLIETRVHLKIIDGSFKGKTKIAFFKGENDLPKDMFYKEGDTVFIGISKVGTDDPVEFISLYDIDNSSGIIFLIALLLISIILVGRIKGLFSMIALVITVLLLFFVLIPLALKGYSPLPITVLISIFSIIITLPIIAGIKLKTLTAILGASSGIVIASLLAITFGWMMHLSGIVTNEMLTVFYASDVNIDLRGLALSGMIIAALGAIMDVCISIASSTAEIYSANPKISQRDAFRSVLTIGTDILGSMVNTLILAYVGSSLSLILLISMRFEPGMPLWLIFNYNPILSEIVKSVVGSIGMFVCIPITAFLSVKMYYRRFRENTGAV